MKNTKPTPPEIVEQTNAQFRVELDFDVRHQQLNIRSKASTLVLQSIIGDALDLVKNLPQAPLPEDAVIRLVIEHDMAADKTTLAGAAPRLLVKGVLRNALGAVTRNQIQQQFQVYKAEMEKRVAALEARLGEKKLILPGANA